MEPQTLWQFIEQHIDCIFDAVRLFVFSVLGVVM